MKIALVLDCFDARTGGLANWTVQLAGYLAGQGHDVHVIGFAAVSQGIPVTIHIVSDAGSIFDRALAIEACVATLRPDVVHDTGTSWSGDVFQPQTGSRLVAFYRDTRGLPWWSRILMLIRPRILWWQICLLRLERRQIEAAHRIIAVSGLVARTLSARHGIRPPALSVIHNGVDTDRFAPSAIAPRRAAGRAVLGLGDTEVLFVVVAQNFRLKNLDTVLLALSLLHRTGQDAWLAVAGGTPDAEWHALVARLGLSERVQFCGHVADMGEFFAAADCLLHPTRWDACSLATLESLACGVPVITTAANGAADAITEGESGYIIADPHDARGLAERMSTLLDPVRRRAMAVAARAAGVAFDSRAKFAAVEGVLTMAAAARARP